MTPLFRLFLWLAVIALTLVAFSASADAIPLPVRIALTTHHPVPHQSKKVQPAPVVTDEPSSGNPQFVDINTVVQYVPPHRVWWTDSELLVCPIEYGTSGSALHTTCDDGVSKDAGWTLLSKWVKPGYYLRSVQVNTTKDGPSLVLYWHKNHPKKAAK